MFVFDFEVLKYNWLVVIKNMTTGQYINIVDDVDALRKFYEENKEKLFVGFNNKHYDDYIFKVLLLGEDPYYATNVIIRENNILKLYRLFDIKKYKLYSIDIAQDAMRGSLKEFEGYLGLNIEESPVRFDIDRPLTPEEIKSVLEYCTEDVNATEYLVKFRIDAVKSKLDLVSEFKLAKEDLSKTNAQLVAKILKARKTKLKDELTPFDISVLNISLDNKEIVEFYTNEEISYDKTLKVDIANVTHILAYGGLHGALENFHYKGELWLLDVASYYPSMMIHYDYISRGITKDNRKNFVDMYYDRLEMKKRGEKKKSLLYKIILNTVYGCMKSEYNDLYDPKNANNVCIAGQLMLIDLIEKLSPYCKLVQSNTDGICIIPYDKDKINEITKEWEQRTKMNLELEIATAIYQKDVNNYILVKEKEVKVRGGFVYQSDLGSKNHAGTMIRNSNSILDECVVNYFVNNITPEQVINNCNDLMKFQIITKSGGTYDDTYWEYNGELIKVNKVNRVYATLDTRAGKLYKCKNATSLKAGKQDSVANQPTHAMLANKNEFDITLLDRDYYIDMAWKRINSFKGD